MNVSLIMQSDVGILVVVSLIAFATHTLGWKLVLAFYGLPYLVVNAHLVLITYLQHTAPYIPHYRSVRTDAVCLLTL